jgi:hypothetical protein
MEDAGHRFPVVDIFGRERPDLRVEIAAFHPHDVGLQNGFSHQLLESLAMGLFRLLFSSRSDLATSAAFTVTFMSDFCRSLDLYLPHAPP